MVTNMNPEEDFMTIYAAEQRMAMTEAARKKELDQAHSHLKSLAKLLDAARTSSTRPKSKPTPQQHAANISHLEETKVSLGKAINDAESSLAYKEAELAELKEETKILEESDPATEHENELDGTALRLAIFKGIGFEPIVDDYGNVVKMLIRSRSGDVHCIQFDGTKPDHEFADMLWELVVS
ncbi:hypothetical protein GLOTRDRAFT_104340 [Gloeophyllum trabeum ATCC 11539]|uniref:Kinetochore protein Spc24 n=1 Tax=Gloeophyllum trabeum (strain ATCC 11539 / FP-39264 / Madison 617) TaxID=670483 RepID=S7QG87_GLOTA|nr:uncharacterized protein GLOTRDRAFT_104340 [Gloeophyllum trabeum ATCC 11539]EPQ58437.1 hypothetical protein GLOTRDRAFT_104340 [Gloeophyllum trabeum ATCC 11539]